MDKRRTFSPYLTQNTFGNVHNKIGKGIENLRWMDVCRRGKGEVKRKKEKCGKVGVKVRGKL